MKKEAPENEASYFSHGLLAAVSPKSDQAVCQAAAIAAAFFRFLRQPSRPIAPRPVAKSGKAAGRGVAGGGGASPTKP